MVHQIKEQLGLFLEKEQLTYIGHIHQQIKKDKYFDNTFVQSYLYVTDHAEKDFADAGNVVKVNFGDKKMRIKKSIPARRKSFRARHNCANPGPRWKARYWSCRAW